MSQLGSYIVEYSSLTLPFFNIKYHQPSSHLIKYKIMGLTLSSETLDIIGIIYSGIGIALAFFEAFVKKVHSRALDYIQWSYILVLANTTLLGTFSNYLYVGSSLITLNPQALSEFYCPMGTYVCVRAFALSFLAILVGFLVIMRFITIPDKVTQKGITFPRVYRLFKGLFKWFYLPLVYLSISTLISSSNIQISIAAVVVLAVLLIFPVVQLVLYKRFDDESEDIFIKWLQFCNYIKAALFALLVVLATNYATTSFYYYIAFIIVAYALFFGLKHNFGYEVVGRVIYISGEVIFYFLYSLFVSGSTWLSAYSIDLFALGIILAMDIVYLIMESVMEYKKWKSQGEIIPEDSKDGPTKKNRYEVQEPGLIGSKDNLNDSRASSNNILGNSSNIKKKDVRPRPGGR